MSIADNHPNPLATSPDAPLWVAESSYGVSKVFEYHPNRHDHGTYGHELGPFPRKTAEAVACALNNAYNRGLTDNQGELTMEFWLLLQHWLLIQIAPGAYWSRFVWALYHYANAWSYQNTKWCQWAVYAKQHMLAYSCS